MIIAPTASCSSGRAHASRSRAMLRPEGTGPYNDLLSWKRALSVYAHVIACWRAGLAEQRSRELLRTHQRARDRTRRAARRARCGALGCRGRGLTDPEDFRRAALVINGQVTVFV